MGSLLFRDALFKEIAEWSHDRKDFRLLVENGPKVDMNQDETPIVRVEIIYSNSEQADLHVNPFIKDEGSVLITVLVRAMNGMRKAYALRDELDELLRRKDFGGAVTAVGRKISNTAEIKGWVGYRLAVPFRHYYTTR